MYIQNWRRSFMLINEEAKNLTDAYDKARNDYLRGYNLYRLGMLMICLSFPIVCPLIRAGSAIAFGLTLLVTGVVIAIFLGNKTGDTLSNKATILKKLAKQLEKSLKIKSNEEDEEDMYKGCEPEEEINKDFEDNVDEDFDDGEEECFPVQMPAFYKLNPIPELKNQPAFLYEDLIRKINSRIFRFNCTIELLNELDESFGVFRENRINPESLEKAVSGFSTLRERIECLLVNYHPAPEPNLFSSEVGAKIDNLGLSMLKLHRIVAAFYNEAKKFSYKHPTKNDSFEDFERGRARMIIGKFFNSTNLNKLQEKPYSAQFSMGNRMSEELAEFDSLHDTFTIKRRNILRISENAHNISCVNIPPQWINEVYFININLRNIERLLRAILNQENLEMSLNYPTPDRSPLYEEETLEAVMRLRSAMYGLLNKLTAYETNVLALTQISNNPTSIDDTTVALEDAIRDLQGRI